MTVLDDRRAATVALAPKAEKQFRKLAPSEQAAVTETLRRLRLQAAKKAYRLHFDPEGAFAVKASKRTRVIAVNVTGGWHVREIVDRTDNRYYRSE